MGLTKTQVVLATLTAGEVSAHFHDSVCELLENPIPDVEIVRRTVRGGPLVAHQRNIAAQDFLNGSADYLLFADSDMRFFPTDVKSLIDTVQDIIGGRYYGYSEPRNEIYPTWQSLNGAQEKGLLECSHVGMGFTLIRRGALEQLGVRSAEAWPFATEVVDGLHAGEDVTFCHRARLAGLRVFLNADVRVYHAKMRLV